MVGKLFGIGFLLLSVSAVIGVDYNAALKGKSAADYSLSDHVSARLASVQALKTAVAPASALDAMMPPVAEGWTVRDYAIEDNFIIMGQEPDDLRLKMMKAVDKATYGSMRGERLLRRLYQSGDKVIGVELAFVPGDAVVSDGARRMEMILDLLDRQTEPSGVTLAGGIEVRRIGGPAFGNSVTYMGRKDRQVYVSIATNVDEDEAAAFLKSIDTEALLKLAADDPGPETVPPLESMEIEGMPVAEAGAQRLPGRLGGGCEKRGAGTFCSATE